jgi:hypothetical protein
MDLARVHSHRGCGSAVGWTKFAYLEGELLSKNTPPSWRVQGQRYTNCVSVSEGDITLPSRVSRLSLAGVTATMGSVTSASITTIHIFTTTHTKLLFIFNNINTVQGTNPRLYLGRL